MIDIAQQVARDMQALIDLEAAIKIRIVDQSFPTNSGARFLKVNSHHDF